MPAPLILHLTDYRDDAHWRWALHDANDRFLADHEVRLETASLEYRGFVDLADYLDFYSPIRLPAAQLAELGAWIGLHVFGDLRTRLAGVCRPPATAVTVTVPPQASGLLLRPLELARLPDGRSFAAAGIRFVYSAPPPNLPHTGGGADFSSAHNQPLPRSGGSRVGVPDELRLLAIFTLPDETNPLNLRRERHNLQKLVRAAQSQGKAVSLRVLQYGATRASLRAALEEAPGWDVVQISGHGLKGELVLEDERGGVDRIGADELAGLLELGQERLRLLILNACYSGAASHDAARARIGLDNPPTRQGEAERAEDAPARPAESEQVRVTVLPSLGQQLAERLACATLAMRYPVGDAFAADLMHSLYDKLLDKGRALPGALHLALDEILAAQTSAYPPLSPATPILLGRAAQELQLSLPARAFRLDALPSTALGIAFPPESDRFVGRLGPMRRASQALAPANPRRGVLFYGMPGAGKTACALELAHRHGEGRFVGYVWFKGPEMGMDVSRALFEFLFEMERQLDAPQLALTAYLDNPAFFRQRTLPRLGAVLEQNALLLVLDNLENLLTASDGWRDPLWGDTLATFLAQRGGSRVILTSRRLPATLAEHPALQREAIHALSFAESVLLAQELPNLARLFASRPRQELLQRTLRIVQGHPKLLELADGLAGDVSALAGQVAAAEREAEAGTGGRASQLDIFFAPAGGVPAGVEVGESRQAEADFVLALRGWTGGVAARLSPAGALLLTFLCGLEEADRQSGIVQANWGDFLKRMGSPLPADNLETALAELAAAGLVEKKGDWENGRLEIGDESPVLQSPNLSPEQLQSLLTQLLADADPAQTAALQSLLADPAALQSLLAQSPVPNPQSPISIHPGVAESVRAGANPAHLAAVDKELGDYFYAMAVRALQNEMQGGSGRVAEAARRGAPYLMRSQRWEEASTLLERLLQRDGSPATTSFALPLLRRIVEATDGTPQGIGNAGVLARGLRAAGRVDEAEQAMRALIERCVAQGNYRLASVAAGSLLNLLRAAGRLEEALALADEMAGYSRQAGLGPWTQLADEVYRLQVLNALGRYDEVLAAVEEARPRMAALPLPDATGHTGEETVNPWNVREGLLDTGRSAAMRSERWAMALELNDAIFHVTEARGADALELARTRFNDYFPLLRLQRFDQARALLTACRRVFEVERDIPGLGNVYSALADLADKTGDRAGAVDFERTALRYTYQAGAPENCAFSHGNIASYLERSGADSGLVLAHRLATAVIFYQTQSGQLPVIVRHLQSMNLRVTPPAFAAVVAAVEAVDGVRFGWLFERLPRRVADGDGAIAAVWGLVGEEIQRRESAVPDMTELLERWEPLLQGIAAVAMGDDGPRQEIEALLPTLEEKGWRLSGPVARIWAGERDRASLTAGIDGNSAQLVGRVLEILAG